MKAIGNYILIHTVEEEMETDSGLLLSSEDKNSFRYKLGEVVTPGTGVAGVNKGDKIYYDKAQSHSMMIKGEKLTIIQEKDVVVVL